MELQEQDSKAFEEIVSILQCHPEIEKFELNHLTIEPVKKSL